MKIRRIIRRNVSGEPIGNEADDRVSLRDEDRGIQSGIVGAFDPRRDVQPFYDDISSLSGTSPWRTTSTGHHVKIKLNAPELIHPFKGIRKGARLQVLVETEKYGVIHDGECMVSNWSDDPVNGETVSLKLAEMGGVNPFEVLDAAETFMMKAWLVNDDESFASITPVRKRFFEKPAVQQANIMTRMNRDFWNFCYVSRDYLSQSAGYVSLQNPEISESFATMTVYAFCGISSRSQLKGDDIQSVIAKRKWMNLMETFNMWRSGRP